MSAPEAKPALLSRREAIVRIALVVGGPLIGLDAFLRGGPTEGGESAPSFSPEDLKLLDEIGETIIPATDTPGAKAVGIGAFMAMMVRECCDDRQRAAFRTGLAAIEAAAQARFGAGFLAAAPAQRTELLTELDRQAHGPHPADAAQEGYRLIKQLTLVGYFTSEIGATQVLRYVETPGSLDGNAPYRAGERAWFNPASPLL
jgi:hypothetical protein